MNPKVLNSVFSVIILVIFSGCASVQTPKFSGSIKKTDNALVVVDTRILSSGGFTFKLDGNSYVMPIRQKGLNYLELPPGRLSFNLVSTHGYRFKPTFNDITLKPNTIHYLGSSITRFDFEKSVANIFTFDREEEIKVAINSEFPELLKKYAYENSVLTPYITDYGAPSDYDSTNIPKPTSEYAVLVIYRTNTGGGDWVTSGIHIDKTRIVGLELDNYTWIKIKPGDYLLKAHLGLFQHLAAQRKVTLEAGEAYFYHFGYDDIGLTMHRKTIPDAVEIIKSMEYDEAKMELFKPKVKKKKKSRSQVK
jgi:hypothetical protein